MTGKDKLLDLAKQARERKIVYSDNNEKDIAVCHELEIMARVAEKMAIEIEPENKFRGLLCSAEYGDIEITGKQAGVLWAIALVNGNKKLVTERLKWWKFNLSYKAPEQLRDCLNSMFKEFLDGK